jgi:hypothetical protein
MKYGNHKTTVDNIIFDSKREARRYGVLKALERGKVISDLQLQVKFELVPAQKGGLRKELPVAYIADFVYTLDGKQVIEDVKGVSTRDFVIKRKLMKLKGLEVTVIK